ncbi:MAG: HDIG domain-containing protein [Deltaproteobacteria bacterium]|nr:HDIG domain-containing protein [Deltaproteobacteria bacterium]
MLETKKHKAAQKIKENGQKAVSLLFVLLLSLSVTALMVLYIDRLPSNIHEGSIASQDIRADKNYEITDTQATETLKQDAEKKSLSVYKFDTNLAKTRKQKILESFAKAREELSSYLNKEQESTESKLTEEQESTLRQNFLLNLEQVLNDEGYNTVRKLEFSEELEKTLTALTDPIQKRPVILDKAELLLRKDNGILLKIIDENDGRLSEDPINDFSNFLSLEEAQGTYKKTALPTIQKQTNLDFISPETIKKALVVVPQMLKINVTFDATETDSRKTRARDNVQSIIYKLQKGQIIIRNGDRYEQRHITILDGIRKARLQTSIMVKFLGVFCLVLSTLLIVYLFAFKGLKTFKPTRKDLNFLGLVLILFLAILRLGSFIGSSVQDSVPFNLEITTLYYAIPIAAGVMLVRFILNPVITLVFCIVLSFFSGLFLEQNYQLTAYYFLSSLFGAYLIGGVEKRSTVLRRGLYLGLINTIIVLCLFVINTASSSSAINAQPVFVNCFFAFLAGVFASLTLLAVSPIMEAVFNYTTNIQLLELANMNHPLLREMIVRSPGTYLHSQLVGTLAETGTRAIGGNSLLARVASYYHDIGKMKKPVYFIENQKNHNPHDTLAPSMSALIVESHVKEGLEMAKEYNLPSVIADFIPQHQGTKLIGYFFQKASSHSTQEKNKIDERSYRYKGPKPQTREAGVVMLADTIEAAVRSMSDKSPQKIRVQVEKLLNAHFVDGQLDECDLTLRDLHLIVDAFVKILVSIYHQRVEYPETGQKLNLGATDNNKNAERKNSHHQPLQPPSNSNISPLFKEKR